MEFLSSIGIFLWFSEIFFHRFLYGIILFFVFAICQIINQKRPDLEMISDRTVGFVIAYLITLFLKQSISYWILIVYAIITLIYALFRKFAPVSMKRVKKRVMRHIAREEFEDLVAIAEVDNHEVKQIVFDSIADIRNVKSLDKLKKIRHRFKTFEELKRHSIDIIELIIKNIVNSNSLEDVEYLLTQKPDYNSYELTIIRIILENHKERAVDLFLKYGSDRNALLYKDLEEILIGSQNDALFDALLIGITKSTTSKVIVSNIQNIISKLDKEHIRKALLRYLEKESGAEGINSNILSVIKDLKDKTDFETVEPMLEMLNEGGLQEVLLMNEYQQAPTTSDMFEYGEYEDYDGLTITRYIGESKNIVIPSTHNGKIVSGIAGCAFEDKDIKSLVIAPTIQSIGDEAFYGNQLEAVFIPDSVEVIGADAFKNNNLNYVRLSKNLKKLGVEAFCRNKMYRVKAPQSILIGNEKMKFMLMQAFDPGLKIDIIPD